MSFFNKLITLVTGDTISAAPGKRSKITLRDLIKKESEIGGQLFGPVPKGHQRDFFCLDKSTWVWHEQWVDSATRKKITSTIRYEVHDNGVLKIQEGSPYTFVEGEELNNLVWAMHLYYQEVARNIYHYDPTTGKPLALSGVKS